MPSHDRYKGIKPETASRASGSYDALQAMESAYRIYIGTADAILEENSGSLWPHDGNLSAILYGEACRLVADSGIRQYINGSEAVERIKSLWETRAKLDGTGLFLSALLNLTGMEEMVIGEFPYLDEVGYRLGESKTLVLGREASVFAAGSRGNGTVISWGRANDIAEKAEGGLYVNHGLVENGFGGYAKDSLLINAKAVKFMTYESSECVSLNTGTVKKSLGFRAKGGFCGNWHYADSIGVSAESGTYYNKGVTDYFEKNKEALCINSGLGRAVRETFDTEHNTGLKALARRLDLKVSEIGFLTAMEWEGDKTLGEIRNFDSRRFGKEILGIADEIREYLEAT